MLPKLSSSISGANHNGNRRKLDYYPTPANATIALLDFLQMPKTTVVWEPACGGGFMSRIIKNYGYQTIETDITAGQDFLKISLPCDAIITNPPFFLADKFIIKAVGEAPLVAMLLKSQYWHAAKRLPIFNGHPPAWILPLTWRPDFYEHERKEGKGSPMMDMIWCVWIRGSETTQYIPLEKPYEI